MSSGRVHEIRTAGDRLGCCRRRGGDATTSMRTVLPEQMQAGPGPGRGPTAAALVRPFAGPQAPARVGSRPHLRDGLSSSTTAARRGGASRAVAEFSQNHGRPVGRSWCADREQALRMTDDRWPTGHPSPPRTGQSSSSASSPSKKSPISSTASAATIPPITPTASPAAPAATAVPMPGPGRWPSSWWCSPWP